MPDYPDEWGSGDDLFSENAATPEPHETRARTKAVEEGARDWGRSFTDYGNRMEDNYRVEDQAISDWRNQFRNQYMNQMQQGHALAAGNLRADAGMAGFNPALQRMAGQAGGHMQARMPMAMKGFDAQLSMAEQMARYQNLQGRGADALALQEMYGQIGPAALGGSMNEMLRINQKGLGDAQQARDEFNSGF